MAKLNIDCLQLIFNELQENKNSLYSCLLVNTEWCIIVAPILWRRYSWYNEKKFFNIILSWLPSSSKQLLFNNNIKLPSTILLKPPLFNYIRFCSFPEASKIGRIIKVLEPNNDNHKRNLLEQEIYKLFVSQCKNIRFLWWETSQPLSLFPGASTCFSQLNFLRINLELVNSNTLYELAQICRDLNTLFIYNHSQDLSGLISLIDAQRNLKSVDIQFDIKKETCEELSKALARKDSTINELFLSFINIIQPSHLTSFINLKEISFYIRENYKYNDFREDFIEEIREFQQYLAILEFPDLQVVNIEDYNGIFSSFFRELAMLIEKTKGTISQVLIDFKNNEVNVKNTGILIKAIANNCPNIKVLYTYLIPDDFIHIKSLLINCRVLVEIHVEILNFFANENENIGDELLDILTKFSPNSLITITINRNCKYSNGALEKFFESCRERVELEFYIFYNNYITEDHKLIVRKYINKGVITRSNLK